MKFKVDAKDLATGLSDVGLVAPGVPDKAPSYLFSVRDDGSAYLYSRSEKAVSRVPLSVTDVEGSGDFLFPAKVEGVFKYVKGVVSFDVETDTDNGNSVVKYTSAGGLNSSRQAMNAKNVMKCEPEMSEAKATHEFPAQVLRVALGAVRVYSAKSDNAQVDTQFKTIQVFDDSKPEWAKGDGVLYAADGFRAAYFECSSFKGKHFPLGVEHVSMVMSFLGNCEGTVKLHNTPNMVFLEDADGRTLGVRNRIALHPRYGYYSFEKDQYVLRVVREDMLSSLRQMRAEISDGDLKKIKVFFNGQENTFVFRKYDEVGSSQSDAVPATRLEADPGSTDSFDANLNIDYTIDLFEGAVCNEIELRVALLPKGNKRYAVLRTLDRGWYGPDGKPAKDNTEEGVVECLVTRFSPSME